MEYKEIEDLIKLQKCSEVMDAIQAIKPGTQVTINAQQNIIWNDGNPTNITAQQVADKVAELRIEYDAQEYARKRKAVYPSREDFMEAYTEKEIGGDSTKWDTYIINYNKVRTENPK